MEYRRLSHSHQGRRTIATVAPASGTSPRQRHLLSSSQLEFPEEEPEIPERDEFQAALKESNGSVMEAWKNMWKIINNDSFRIFRPKPDTILFGGLLWVLEERFNIFRCLYTILLENEDLLLYASIEDVEKDKPIESCKAVIVCHLVSVHPRRFKLNGDTISMLSVWLHRQYKKR